MILRETDKVAYFPSISLEGAALTAYLARIQGLVESYCARPLQLVPCVETLPISQGSRTCRLTRLPIALSPVPVVSVRNQFGGPWTVLQSTAYTLDFHDGLLLIQGCPSGFAWPYQFFSTHAKLEYTAGYDFAVPGPDVNLIKSIAAQLAIHLFVPDVDSVSADSQGRRGAGSLKSFEVVGEYREVYDTASGNVYGKSSGLASSHYSQLVDSILFPLAKYRPLGYI